MLILVVVRPEFLLNFKFVHFLQFITTIFNQYTHESSIFNPLRAKRPGLTSDEDPDEYIEELSTKTEKNCDLCEYK